MKKRSLTIVLILLSGIILSLSSCLSDKRNLQTDTYIAGVEIADRVIIMYQEMENIDYITKYQNELISILSKDSVSKNKYDKIIFTDNLENKIAALRSLKKVYSTYNQLTDKDFTLKNSNLSQFVTIACQRLDTLNIDEDIAKQVKEIQEYVAAPKFNKEVVVLKLTEIYIKIWNNDSDNWTKILNESYEKYSHGLDKIPVSVFDEDKLTKFVYEPYQGKNTLVKIYKLNLKEEAYKKQTETINDINQLSLLLSQFNSINLEYTKKTPSLQKIEFTIDKINEIIFKNYRIQKEKVKIEIEK